MGTLLIEKLKSAYFSYDVKMKCRRRLTYFKSNITMKGLSDDQRKAIKDYYQPLLGGGNFTCSWHQVLYSITGVFNKRYLPFDTYQYLIEALSPYSLQKVLDDKNLYRTLLKDFNIPRRIAECSYGVYYLPQLGKGGRRKAEVYEYLSNIENCIIKPSKDSSSGNHVASFSAEEGKVKGEELNSFLKQYGNHFVIEEKVKESENLSQLNPSSCNTLRIHTARVNEQIVYLSSYIRIGRKGNIVDNAHSGGICAKVNDNGTLDNAYIPYPYSEQEKTDSGIVIKGYKIEGFEKMKQTAIDAHSCIPQFGIMGWDVCEDQKGNPVIIEFNPNPDIRMEQVFFHDTCLGDYQDEILKIAFKR